MEELKFREGDIVRITQAASGGLLKSRIGKIAKMGFAGIHNGILKCLDEELLKQYPDKNGWAYEKNFEKVCDENILDLKFRAGDKVIYDNGHEKYETVIVALILECRRVRHVIEYKQGWSHTPEDEANLIEGSFEHNTTYYIVSEGHLTKISEKSKLSKEEIINNYFIF